MLRVMSEDAIETLESSQIRHVQAARSGASAGPPSVAGVGGAAFQSPIHHENRGNLVLSASSNFKITVGDRISKLSDPLQS